jgi:hypothetical protein
MASRDDVSAVIRHLDASRGGIVFSSVGGISKGRAIQQKFPGLIIASDHRERDREARPATPDAPIALPPAGGTLLGELSLEEALEQFIAGQFAAGAHIGVVPGRVIHAEDSESMKALLDLSNRLDRDNVIVRVAVKYPWLRKPDVGQLIDLLGGSRHPVALSPADRRDPLENKGVPAGLRKVTDALGGKVIIWKTDLAGIDALARGALATAIGVVASLRHSSPPGGFGNKIDKTDPTPQIFLPKLLRYVRTSHMHNEWFPSVKPWTCDCGACNGKPVDRFSGSTSDLREAAEHNAIAITELHREIVALGAGHRAALWHEKLEAAQAAHTELSVYIERKVTFPSVLRYWLDNT